MKFEKKGDKMQVNLYLSSKAVKQIAEIAEANQTSKSLAVAAIVDDFYKRFVKKKS